MSVRITFPMSLRNEAEIDGAVIQLPSQEFRMLEAIVMHTPRPVSVNDLIEIIWPDPDAQPLTAAKIVIIYAGKLRSYGINVVPRNGQGYAITAVDPPTTRRKRRRYPINPASWVLGRPPQRRPA